MVVPLRLCFFCQPCNGLQDKSLKPEKMFHAKFGMINGAGWFLEHADPLLKAGLDSEIPKKYGGPHSRVPLSSPPGLFCTQCHTVFMRVFCFLEIRFMLLSQKFFLSPAALMLPHPPQKKKHIMCWACSTLRFFGYPWLSNLLFRIQLSRRIAHPSKIAGLYSTSVQWCIGFCSIPSCRDELVL